MLHLAKRLLKDNRNEKKKREKEREGEKKICDSIIITCCNAVWL